MEKEKKGLLEALAAFWMEKTAGMQLDGIGFQMEKKSRGKKDDSVLGKEEREFFSEEKRKDFLAEGNSFMLAESFGEKKEGPQSGKKKDGFREKTKEKRKIVPVSEEDAAPLQEEFAEEEQEKEQEKKWKNEEPQQETEVDVEGLMREITKKLWEERESCGRRLR